MQYPTHISIIPDGNRTRAEQHGISVLEWYIQSVYKWVELIKHIFTTTPIKVLSGRGMSTENRKKRSEEELNFLFSMYKTCGNLLNDFLLEHKINFRWIGDPSSLPADFLHYMSDMVKQFTFDTDRTLIFAVNYGWQNEIIRWVQSYFHSSQTGATWEEKCDNLNEKTLGSYMDLGAYPPVDLVVRTKWDQSSRISWFMSWWIGYAELFFEPKLFQDTLTSDLDKALKRFDLVSWSRNFGK